MPDISLRQGPRERLERLLGRRRETGFIAVAAVVLAGGGVLLWSRGAPAQIAPPAVAVTPAAPLGTSLPPTGSPSAPLPTTPLDLYVHVAGAVRHPGLIRLQAGTRVADALEAAGGPLPKADLGALNLAEPLVDGSKIEVLRRGAAAAPAPVATPLPGASPSIGVISLNSADQVQLEAIPGVGPVTATAILAFREEIGSFSSVDQLLEVDGIGPATLEEIRPYVTL
jgi:competence protein ComEA